MSLIDPLLLSSELRSCPVGDRNGAEGSKMIEQSKSTAQLSSLKFKYYYSYYSYWQSDLLSFLPPDYPRFNHPPITPSER